ncbi:geranylgeranyl diphosphate synthase type II [Weissella uvarum]|uniref:polyprenyl synthetase family protein n=1 Tax=Weissella uvarum TaxID=1479233 RepID=UPI0019616344|nr:polyprenyl synthetase family protein [Weissella uvarum]MBM7616476.1 geranylgeranyl diphosphate synthase type II [Weissella uvarum]MCM0595063.1 polyprenyl synthetase family protein [Weissella uvarum]
MDLKTFQTQWVPVIQDAMAQKLQQDVETPALQEAMIYAVMAGGKRLRPLLTLAVLDTYHQSVADYVLPASAVELMHTYSLIHDDLPAMDNDVERRGKPTTHIQFGEDLAILAGDAMQPLAFQWLADADNLSDEQKNNLTRALSRAVGPNGMVGGQVLDMQATGAEQIDLSLATQVHEKKTGALIRYALVAGGMMAKVDALDLQSLDTFGAAYGLAFQIKDDLDDLAQDGQADKQSYPAILGVKDAKNALSQAVQEANLALVALKERNQIDISLLKSFLKYFETTLEK